ncbi:NADH-quinone oxidoreductase subunit H [Methanophagales archaeon]|nr:NADH-quinone oxidoreductase subunit H [Methanophagales archaeon]
MLGLPVINNLIALLLWESFFVLIIMPGFAVLGTLLLILPWIERKMVGRMQWRVGPREISPRTRGIIQLLADSLRFLFQEVIIHKDAHKRYFLQFPFLYFIPVLLPLLFINAGTAGSPLVPIVSDYGLQLMVALICLMPVFILGLGWASNNRFAFIGTVREAFLYFAYEIPFIVAVFAMVVMYGTSNSVGVVDAQAGGLWGIILNPIAALTFFIAALMATARLPFDIPEADQEVSFGPFVEFSGIAFGLAYVMGYEKMYVLSALMTMLFLGGGSGPMIPGLGEVSYLIWFVLKTLIVMIVVVNLRGVYPRYRLDQGMKIGWNAMLILALVAVAWSLVIGAII